ncbi:hypothetical protein ABEB36_011534 [Hypothenemus hampei]|uniref:CUB domain-containing protein n=1 Tax=Hypothenemus hampei TaxID=57062 RepID=A0ABD1EAX0_HYPHA
MQQLNYPANLANGLVSFIINLLIYTLMVNYSQAIKELSLGDNKLCSTFTTRKIRYESLLVTEGRSNEHSLSWIMPDICKFEVQSAYPRGGVIAVIQNLNLRKNMTTGQCIDYIQFRSRKGLSSQRFCGLIDGRQRMNYNFDDDAPENVYPEFYPLSYSTSFIDVDGALDVVIYIAREPLNSLEKTAFSVVFTSYQDCSIYSHNIKGVSLKECEKKHDLKICINGNYFHDGYINCPHFGCLDEENCILSDMITSNTSTERVIIGSISTLCILFILFVLIVWAFKKHKLFCWAEEFASTSSPSALSRRSTTDNNREISTSIHRY